MKFIEIEIKRKIDGWTTWSARATPVNGMAEAAMLTGALVAAVRAPPPLITTNLLQEKKKLKKK